MKTSTTVFRSMLFICFLGLMTACGNGEKGATSDSADHGHSHEYHPEQSRPHLRPFLLLHINLSA